MSKISTIIRSKFKDKEDFYFDRLETCMSCEHWSLNSGESKGLLYEIASFGKGHCNICGCGESKLRMPEEECPIGKWKKQYEVLQSTLHTITNNSPEVAKLAKEGTYYSLDYGNIKKGANSEIKIMVNIKDAIHVKSAASCGCTTTNIVKDGDNYNLTIKYNMSNMGEIKGKTVRINYTKDNIRTQISFLIKGTVI